MTLEDTSSWIEFLRGRDSTAVPISGDYMFRLTQLESGSLRCQSGTLKRGQYSKSLPFVFMQEGVAMLRYGINDIRLFYENGAKFVR